MAKYRSIKGAEDFSPEDMSARERVFGILKETARRHSFLEIDVPCVESFALLAAKQGDEIRQQIFTIEKKGDEELAMRAEFTPGFARAFVERSRQVQKPVKWFTVGKVWRYERPQAGRQREFFQFNAELYGSDKPEADAEIINLAIASLKSLGLKRGDFFVRLNSRKLLEGLLLRIIDKVKLEEVMRVIDKMHKLSHEAFLKELSFLPDKESSAVDDLLKLDLDAISVLELEDEARQGYETIKAIMAMLPEGYALFDITVARGLAYYTGTVFEVYDKDRKFRALAGGGRYDNLIEIYGGEKTPATGFAMGYSTLKLLLTHKGILGNPELGPDYYIAVQGDEWKEEAVRLANRLRKNKSVEVDLMRRNLSNQLKHAHSIRASHLIVFGEEEANTGTVRVKDMKTGTEKNQKIPDLI
jgi:histidyl-tRNA synthetase